MAGSAGGIARGQGTKGEHRCRNCFTFVYVTLYPQTDRCAFVRGEPPASLAAAVAVAHTERRRKAKASSDGSMRAWLEKRFVGQPGVVANVAAKLEAIRAHERPRLTASPTVFFFYGVAGVGKTRLAQLISEALGRPRIHVEMESYSAAEDANRLFGSPPGYGQGYSLVDDLIENSRAVVILDEIEKAHPSIFREKFHSILSEGIIRDKRDRNRVANASDAIFVFTSNCFESLVAQVAAQSEMETPSHDWYDSLRTQIARAVNEHPRIPCSDSRSNPFEDASLRSRIPPSKQFPFMPLTASEITRLIEIELERIARQTTAYASVPFDLSWSPDVARAYASNGPAFGDARTASRTVSYYCCYFKTVRHITGLTRCTTTSRGQWSLQSPNRAREQSYA